MIIPYIKLCDLITSNSEKEKCLPLSHITLVLNFLYLFSKETLIGYSKISHSIMQYIMILDAFSYIYCRSKRGWSSGPKFC